MNNPSETEFSALQRFVCNIFAGALVTLCGIFLLLVGLSAVPLRLKDVALPAVLLVFGLISLAIAVLQKNPVPLWVSFFFLIPATIALLVAYQDALTYKNMYPFFISIPAFASLFTMLLSKEYRLHICVASFFGIITILFCLKSFGIASWGVVIPSILVFSGILVLIAAVFKKNRQE